MKRFLKYLLVVVLLAAAVGWLAWSRIRSGAEASLRGFFSVVRTGTDAELLAALDPGFDKAYDRRLVAAWLRAMVLDRGPFTGLVPDGGQYSVEVSTESVTLERYQGKIGFEKGPLDLELVFMAGRLASVSTRDPAAIALVAQADRLPGDVLPYVETGREFWRLACSDDPARAVALMFPGLKDAVGGEAAFAARMLASGRTGKLTDVSFTTVGPGDGPSTADFHFVCRFGSEEVPARIGFWFKSLQAHLVSFDLAAPPPGH